MVSYESGHIPVIFIRYYKNNLKDIRNCDGQNICVAVLQRETSPKKRRSRYNAGPSAISEI